MPDGSIPNNSGFVDAATYITASESKSLFGYVNRLATISSSDIEIPVPGYTKASPDAEGNYYNSAWTGQQGGYFDGRYLYQSFLRYCYNRTTDENGDYVYSKGVNDAYNIVKIVKYDTQTGTIVAESDAFGYTSASEIDYDGTNWLNHAADMTYYDGYLVVLHGSPNAKKLTKINPDTLEVVSSSEADYGMYGIAYNASKSRYVLGISGTYNFRIMRYLTISGISNTLYSGIYEAQAYTKQPICCDDNYIYCLYYGNGTDQIDDVTSLTSDAIIVYDWDGNFVSFIELNFGSEEPEAISAIDGDIYVTTGADGNAYFYKVTGLRANTKEVRITQ